MPGRTAVMLTLVTSLALFPIQSAWTAPQAGEVLALSAQCFLEASGARSALKLGDPVHEGDTVDVPEGSKLKLRMNDGTIISAASGTKLTITAYNLDSAAERRDAKLSLASGLLRAVVSSFGQASHFEVDTATGVAAVRSTDWFIEALPTSTQVGVLSGSVSLTSLATKREVSIPARWGARVEAGRAPVPPRVWTQAEFDKVIARTSLN